MPVEFPYQLSIADFEGDVIVLTYDEPDDWLNEDEYWDLCEKVSEARLYALMMVSEGQDGFSWLENKLPEINSCLKLER